jgi:hypothetical protein
VKSGSLFVSLDWPTVVSCSFCNDEQKKVSTTTTTTRCKVSRRPDLLDRTAKVKLLRKVPRIPAKGNLAGQVIDTTVDSELAKYYLEDYLQDCRCNPKLDLIIGQIETDDSHSIPDREYLKDITRRFSPDFATLYLAKRLLENKANTHLNRMFHQELSSARAGMSTGEFRFHPNSRNYVLLFVPGWVYKSKPESGADLAKPRRVITERGLENRLIQIAETGTIEENADYIAKEIVQFSQLNKKIILVSASTGGPSACLALCNLLKAYHLKKVKAWVNIGGLLQGSFHADAATRWPRCWYTKVVLFLSGWNYDSVESMTTKRSRERIRQIDLQKEIFCVNYVGIPLSGNITDRGRNGYLDSCAEGPNDGMTLITDALMPNGVTIPMVGVDHYFDVEMDLKTVALAQTVMNYLESK